MPKYRGIDLNVYLATSLAALTTAVPMINITSVSWKVNQGITQEPLGFGSRQSVTKEGVIKITGEIKRDYDETPMGGSGTDEANTFAEEANAFEVTALTRYVLAVQNKLTGSVFIFTNVIGDYDPGAGSVEGIVDETFTWSCDTIAYTTTL